jgi:hypothetical protein
MFPFVGCTRCRQQGITRLASYEVDFVQTDAVWFRLLNVLQSSAT